MSDQNHLMVNHLKKSFTFSYKNGPDGTPEWNTIHVSTGSYNIEDINKESITEIQRFIGENQIDVKDRPDKYPIEIQGHEPLLSTTIKLNSPNYAVDI